MFHASELSWGRSRRGRQSLNGFLVLPHSIGRNGILYKSTNTMRHTLIRRHLEPFSSAPAVCMLCLIAALYFRKGVSGGTATARRKSRCHCWQLLPVTFLVERKSCSSCQNLCMTYGIYIDLEEPRLFALKIHSNININSKLRSLMNRVRRSPRVPVS